MIDYTMLWGVKMNWIPKSYEKWVYLYVSMFIRSPGAVMVTYASLFQLPLLQPRWMLGYCVLLIGINFWNGQYYMMKSCRDHERFLMNERFILHRENNERDQKILLTTGK